MTKDDLRAEFKKQFQQEPDSIFFCPGRVNLIGEHIDYNGGKVMPFALSKGTYLAIQINNSGKFRFSAIDFKEKGNVAVAQSYTKLENAWYNHPLGVINELTKLGYLFTGADFLFYGDLPKAAGLSSSASIEVLTGFALSELLGKPIDKKDIALLGKKVENEFIGLNCGIMDQFAVALGKKDQVMLLDCDTMECSYFPFVTGEYNLVVINSCKHRELADSKYNDRFDECLQALAFLQKKFNVQSLCEINLEDFEKNISLIPDEILRKRARHVISENERVNATSIALKKGDLIEVGNLLYQSHESLQHLYEASGKELDAIVNFSKTFDGCIGARMTGAGFGGCAIALVKKTSFDAYSQGLVEDYKAVIGYAPEVFIASVGDGVRFL